MTDLTAFDRLFKRATGWEPYDYQRELGARARPPPVIEVPTGSGKTMAALISWLCDSQAPPNGGSWRAALSSARQPLAVLWSSLNAVARGWRRSRRLQTWRCTWRSPWGALAPGQACRKFSSATSCTRVPWRQPAVRLISSPGLRWVCVRAAGQWLRMRQRCASSCVAGIHGRPRMAPSKSTRQPDVRVQHVGRSGFSLVSVACAGR